MTIWLKASMKAARSPCLAPCWCLAACAAQAPPLPKTEPKALEIGVLKALPSEAATCTPEQLSIKVSKRRWPGLEVAAWQGRQHAAVTPADQAPPSPPPPMSPALLLLKDDLRATGRSPMPTIGHAAEIAALAHLARSHPVALARHGVHARRAAPAHDAAVAGLAALSRRSRFAVGGRRYSVAQDGVTASSTGSSISETVPQRRGAALERAGRW